MNIREATLAAIRQIQVIRHTVTENILSNPELAIDKDCEEFISKREKGWACEIEGEIIGLSIIDLRDNNVWALFLHPNQKKKGVGRLLHDLMLDWYFEQTSQKICLGTSPKTRAEIFYKKTNWREVGKYGKNEIKFEMTYQT
jgi:GNAT superfamily N-acetyltransferase